MKIIKKLLPGQPGAKKLTEKYGVDLICVRYRHDFNRKKRIKTVELIVDEAPLIINKDRIPMNKKTYLRIEYGEAHLSRIVKAAGGKWNRQKRLWELPYKEAIELGFTDRIVS